MILLLFDTIKRIERVDGLIVNSRTPIRRGLLVSHKWPKQIQWRRPYQLVYFEDISQTMGQYSTCIACKKNYQLYIHGIKCMAKKQPSTS